MHNKQIIQWELHSTFQDIYDDINFLYVISDIYTKNLLLNHLWDKLSSLQMLTNILVLPIGFPLPEEEQPSTQLPLINRTELAKYNGKGSIPAYIAVNGLVYDVTNNAAWAAATHFGLTAGKDLTEEFASCHGSQRNILTQLKIVGRFQ